MQVPSIAGANLDQVNEHTCAEWSCLFESVNFTAHCQFHELSVTVATANGTEVQGSSLQVAACHSQLSVLTRSPNKVQTMRSDSGSILKIYFPNDPDLDTSLHNTSTSFQSIQPEIIITLRRACARRGYVT